MKTLDSVETIVGHIQDFKDVLIGDKEEQAINKLDPFGRAPEVRACIKACEELEAWVNQKKGGLQ